MFDSRGVRASSDALVCGVGGSGGRAGRRAGRAGRVDRGVAGRVGGVAATGGPGFLDFLAAAEYRRAGREGESEGGQAAVGRQSQQSPDGQLAEDEPGRPRRKQGGQPGHRGSGLGPVATPDHREPVEPSCCAGCGAGLAGAPGQVASRVQVFDLPCAMRRSVISPAQRGEIGGISLDLMANPAPKGNIGNSSMPGNQRSRPGARGDVRGASSIWRSSIAEAEAPERNESPAVKTSETGAGPCGRMWQDPPTNLWRHEAMAGKGLSRR